MIDAFIRYYERSSCFFCGRDLNSSNEKRWIAHGISRRGRRTEVDMCQSCQTCADMAVHIADAEAQQIRFTPIGCGVKEISSPEGDRCICGAVSHRRLGFCIQCWRANRMLEKAQAEARLISKALKELRAEIKSIQRPELV